LQAGQGAFIDFRELIPRLHVFARLRQE
jgi:hypothetical protein